MILLCAKEAVGFKENELSGATLSHLEGIQVGGEKKKTLTISN